MEVRLIGYDDYSIDLDGNVYSFKCKKKRLMRGSVDAHGYIRVTLSKDGIQFSLKIHLLMKDHFLPHVKNKNLTVNHVSEVKTDNSIGNLELMSHSDNVKSWFKNKKDRGEFKYQNIEEKEKIDTSKHVFINGQHFSSFGLAAAYIHEVENRSTVKNIRKEISKMNNGHPNYIIYKKYEVSF